MPNDYRLREPMVNEALSAYLDTNNERVRWFFGLNTSRPGGETITLTELCGFGPDTDDFGYSFERGLTREEDPGAIPPEDFSKTYWGVRPDFRFWALEKRRQLIVEGKARRPADQALLPQARRYFNYLRQFRAEGALVYLVPCDFRLAYLQMLAQATDGSQIPFGVICWDETLRNDPILKPISTELVHCIQNSIAGPLALIQRLLEPDRPER